MQKRVIKSLSLSGFIFGFAGWVYIVINSEVHPYTLHWRLTHFATWPHEDTFGEICFLIALISFFIYNFIKDKKS